MASEQGGRGLSAALAGIGRLVGRPTLPSSVTVPAPPPRRLPRGTIPAAALAMIGTTIALEGNFVDHPNDPGGATRWGVTEKVARRHGYRGPMRTLPREVAESIYYEDYLVAPGYEPLIALDAAVTEELFDTTVNMGPRRPSRWFQAEINARCGTALAVDGRVGPATVGAFGQCQVRHGSARLCRAMLDSLDARQRAEYDRLVRVNPRLAVFHRGWLNHRIGNVDRRKCAAAPDPVAAAIDAALPATGAGR